MFAGAIFKSPLMQWRARSDGSGTASSNMFPCFVGHQASIASFFTPDYLNVALGFEMSVSTGHWVATGYTHPTESPFRQYTLTFPAIHTNAVIRDEVYSGSVESLLEFQDVAVYQNFNANWEIHIGEIRWLCDGVLRGRWQGKVVYSTMVPTPMAVPIFPGISQISASATALLGEPSGVPLPAHSAVETTSTALCGSRYQTPDGQWVNPAVIFPDLFYAPYQQSGITIDGIVSGGDTWNGVMHCHSYNEYDVPYDGSRDGYECYGRYVHNYSRSGSALLIPNWDKTVTRLNDDYAAMIYRGAFPQVTAQATTFDLYYRDGYDQHSSNHAIRPPWIFNYEKEVLPAESEFLAVVQNGPHVIEDPLTKTTYSGMNIGGAEMEFRFHYDIIVPPWIKQVNWLGYPGNPPGTENWRTRQFIKGGGCYFTYPYGVYQSEEPGNNILSYLTHSDQTVVYYNTWGNPHWSYLIYMPLESQHLWKIQENFSTPQSYFLKARTQFLDHPSLPSTERLQIRNDIVTEPLWENGLAGLIQNQVFGQITSWWGVPRPVVDHKIPLSGSSLEKTSPVNFKNCTGTAGASDITIDPGSGSAVIEFPVGQHNSWPYMFPFLANTVTLGTGTNVESVQYDLIDAVGKIMNLPATGLESTQYVLPRAPTTKYEGSWGTDQGVGEVLDQGTDLITSNGVSAQFMADGDRVGFPALAPSGQYTTLRITIIRSDESQPCKVLYPRWDRPISYGTDFKLHTETAMVADVIESNAPGFRYGQQSYFDYFNEIVLTTPYAAEMTGMATALDWLTWRRNVYEGRLATDLLDPEISTIWDKGIEWTQIKHLACDPFNCATVTTSFMLNSQSEGPKGVLINSYSQVPPMAGFPNAILDGNLRVIGYGMNTYSKVTTKRNHLVPGTVATQLIAPDGTTDWLTSEPTLPGWTLGTHVHKVTNGETFNYKIRYSEKDYAAVHPWHGYFWTPGLGLKIKGLHMDRSHVSGMHFLVESSDSQKLLLHRFNSAGQSDDFTIYTSANSTLGIAQVAYRPGESVGIVFEEDETIKRIISFGQGEPETWSNSLTICLGTNPAYAIDLLSSAEYAASYNLVTGSWDLWRMIDTNATEPSFSQISTIVSTTASDSCAALECSPDSSRTLVFSYKDDSGNLQRLQSTNFGETWRS